MKKQTKKQKSYKADIFTFFEKAHKGDFSYVDSLTDEEVKEISPYVLLSWAQGGKINTEAHIMMTDAYMNDKVFPLAQHPRLLLKLFVAANEGLGSQYGFVKPKGVSSDKNIQAIAEYYQCTIREAADYAKILSPEAIKEIASIMEN